MENALLTEALRLASIGFKVFPCVPGEKRPLTEHGVHDASSDENQIEAWWEKWPRANLAISCEGLLVVDYDDPTDSWPNDENRSNDISACPLARTPGTGYHRLMRQLPGQTFGNTAGKLGKKIDTRGTGGYILVAPSKVGGKPYVWIQPIESWEEIPNLFDWLAELLRAIETTGGYNGTGEGFLGGAAIPDGEQNDTLHRIGSWLRQHGFSQEQIEATLLKVSEQRCVDREGNPYPHPPARVAKIAASCMRYEPDVFRVAAMEDAPPDAAPDEYPDPGRFPARLVDEAPGIMQEIVQYTLATSPRPQPVFALAGALSLMSTLTGHKIRDESNLRTNLLVIAAGQSASGKDRCRQVNREILSQIGADDLLGSEEIQSGNGVYTVARTQPCSLLQLDEIGKMLLRIKNSTSDALANVTSTLMKLYSASGGPCKIGGYADPKRNFMLEQPHCVVLGTTVVKSFTAALTSEQLDDGFLSRNLFFHSESFPSLIRVISKEIPPDLLEKCRAWWAYQPKTGNLAGLHPEPLVVPYTPAALEAIEEFQKFCDKLTPSHPLWGRAVEKMKKCAMNYQASLDGPPAYGVGGLLGGIRAFDEPAIRWASGVVEYQTREVLHLASQWISDSQIENHTKRVLRWLRSKNRNVTMNEYTRANQYLGKKQRSEVLETLVASGQIVTTKDGRSTKIRVRH